LCAIWIAGRVSATLSIALSTGSFFPFKRYGKAEQGQSPQAGGITNAEQPARIRKRSAEILHG
jgi:hypothetical protein